MNNLSKFVGRKYELDLFKAQYEKGEASLTVVYGRRRVGKTRLVTEFYKDKKMWKFDGVENEGKVFQIKNILRELSKYTGDDIYNSIDCNSWIELLKILDRAIAKSPGGHRLAVFFDEFQYIASRQTELVSAVKWAWDNLWQNKGGFSLILCGSVASFMINKVVKSSSLYGRVTLEICLKPLSVPKVYEFFKGKKSIREICDLYMFCGGIPEYLRQIDPKKSVYQNLSLLGFTKDGYFVHEFDRIFKDIFREEMVYKKIILELSRYKSLKIPELADALGVSAGGGFADYLDNLETAGFVKSVVPWNKINQSKLERFRLDDEYLLFYFKFIHPNLKRIGENADTNYGLSVMKGASYKSWAGFAFERLCLKHAAQIMRFLKIEQLVKAYGAYFDKKSNEKNGVQIDLLFERHDPVVTICEMKYHDGLVGKEIIEECEHKAALLGEKRKTVEQVLITTNGITKGLKETNYFSRVIALDELF